MAKKKEHCWPLEFAKNQFSNEPYMRNLDDCEAWFAVRAGMQPNPDYQEAKLAARVAFTVNRWLNNKQCYSITKELADDLFSVEDLSVPMDALPLPFPCFYLDTEPFDLYLADENGKDPARILGYYVMLDEVPSR